MTNVCGTVCVTLGIAPDLCDAAARSTATLLLVLGGLGLRSAARTRAAGFWASWADCLPMIEARHPEVAARIIAQLEGEPSRHSVWHAAQAAHGLAGVHGFEPPSWRALAAGLRPPRRGQVRVAADASSRTEAGTSRVSVQSVGRTREGSAQARRLRSWSCAADMSHMSSHSHRPCTVPRFAVATSPFVRP